MEATASAAATGENLKSPHELGTPIKAFRCGFGSSKGLMIFGAFSIVFPLIIGIVGLFDPHYDASFALSMTASMEAFFLPLGAIALWAGIRNRRVLLTLFEDGLEYVTPARKRLSARYGDLQSVSLQGVSKKLSVFAPVYAQSTAQRPNSIEVSLRGGWSLSIKCLGAKDLTEAAAELERRRGIVVA